VVIEVSPDACRKAAAVKSGLDRSPLGVETGANPATAFAWQVSFGRMSRGSRFWPQEYRQGDERRLPVYRFLRTRTRSDDEAADLTASAFERAPRSFPSYDAHQPALPWVLRIARNVAIDAARRRRPTGSLDDPTSYELAVDSDSPEAQYLHAERDAELRDLVYACPTWPEMPWPCAMAPA
jgi:Sigma-70 region 2